MLFEKLIFLKVWQWAVSQTTELKQSVEKSSWFLRTSTKTTSATSKNCMQHFKILFAIDQRLIIQIAFQNTAPFLMHCQLHQCLSTAGCRTVQLSLINDITNVKWPRHLILQDNILKTQRRWTLENGSERTRSDD